MIEPPIVTVDPDPDAPPPPRDGYPPFIRGVVIGTVILNGLTLALAPFVEFPYTGFFVAIPVTVAAALAFLFQRKFAVAGGLFIAAVISPLLAYPSCSLLPKIHG